MSSEFTHIHSERKLPGWKVSKPFIRNQLQPKGVTPGKYMQTHNEPKSKDVRSSNSHAPQWQKDFSKIIQQDGDKIAVVVDSVTYITKTWLIDEILATTKTQPLIISSNGGNGNCSIDEAEKFITESTRFVVFDDIDLNTVKKTTTRVPEGCKIIVLLSTVCDDKETAKKSGMEVISVVNKIQPYDNPLMSPWQKELSKIINKGNNVIVDTVTSTGKTWAANLIVAHETLERDSRTRALIISPNSEVMRDTAGTINSFQNKIYKYSGTMMSTMTRNYVSYDPARAPSGQIVVVTVDSVVEFLTDPKHAGFVEWLQFVVFDEVHLKSVSESLWWTQFIPHHAQLIMLSATLGDPVYVQKIVDRMQHLQKDRPRETKVISYYVRPIPLQLVMFKGCDMPKTIISRELKGAGRLACAISTDPTTRDISSVCPEVKIPDDREHQYRIGQEILAKFPDVVKQKNKQAMTEIITDPTAENILKVLCYLFSNEMQPVMVFHATTEQTRYAAEQLVGLLTRLENDDPELREARRMCEKYDKEVYRSRDKKDTTKGGKTREKELNSWERAMPSEPEKSEDINRMRAKLNQWNFPCDLTEEELPKNMEAWISASIAHGIGIYVSTMPVWLRHFTFDAFRAGKIKVLLSDSTISVGINLPIRTCVLCGHVPHHLYKQASGRAGRRGMDTKGFIVHLMPEGLIRSYVSSKSVDMTIQTPETMTYAGLIRLQIPANLDSEPNPTPAKPAEPVAGYKLQILQNYYNTLSTERQQQHNVQLSRIRDDAWAYHRLTNFIKTLPCSESILIIKLLTTGVLHRFEPTEFIDLMSILFYRREMTPENNKDDSADVFYLPTFERFPGLMDDLKKHVKHYGLNIDLNRPVHHYFSQFCQGRQYLEYLEDIQDMGEWLYIFKRGLTDMDPSEPQIVKDANGKDTERRELIDDFIKTVYKVDSLYLSGVSRKKAMLIGTKLDPEDDEDKKDKKD
jgi:superfamily II DNA/RNA helicase